METMQIALASENEDTIGRPPFHLRNGDLVVWTDISWKPTEKHIALRQEIEKKKKESPKKDQNDSKNNGKKSKSSIRNNIKRIEGGGLKIRTHEEWMEEEAAKKAKSELEKKMKEEEGGTDQTRTEVVELPKSDKHKMFDVMVTENEEDLQNPKPRQ